MHYLYILYSKLIDKYYVGESNEPKVRLKLHNEHHFKKGFTKAAEDWELKLSFECNSKEEAIYLEKFIKRMKSKVFIVKVLNNPEILKDILSKK